MKKGTAIYLLKAIAGVAILLLRCTVGMAICFAALAGTLHILTGYAIPQLLQMTHEQRTAIVPYCVVGGALGGFAWMGFVRLVKELVFMDWRRA